MSGIRAFVERYRETGALAWLHFVVLLALGLGVNVLRTTATAGPGGPAPGAVLEMLLGALFHLLPVVAGISVGVLGFRHSAFRQAALLAVMTLVLMAGLDIVGRGPALHVLLGRLSPGSLGGVRSLDPTQVSAIGTAVAFIRGQLQGWADVASAYPPGHPRLTAAVGLVSAGSLLLSLVLVGMVLGIEVWLTENVTFHTPAAERLGRLLVAWFVSPGAYYFAMSWMRAVMVQRLMRPGPLLSILLPLLPFVAVGSLGWLKAWRANRFLE